MSAAKLECCFEKGEFGVFFEKTSDLFTPTETSSDGL